MRTHFRHWLAIGFAALFALALSRESLADEDFTVAVSAGKVVVTAKGDWHINKEYPWKLIVGDQKIAANQFTLTDTAASVKAPAGAGQLKGGICSEGQCRTFQQAVKIP